VNVDGSGLVDLTADSAEPGQADHPGTTKVTTQTADGEPIWSLDGTKLAYVHVLTGRRRLVTSSLDGSGLTVVTPNLERDVDDPDWSGRDAPDGYTPSDVFCTGPDAHRARRRSWSRAGERSQRPIGVPRTGTIA
jgi:Tol biopolymer transport system component